MKSHIQNGKKSDTVHLDNIVLLDTVYQKSKTDNIDSRNIIVIISGVLYLSTSISIIDIRQFDYQEIGWCHISRN